MGNILLIVVEEQHLIVSLSLIPRLLLFLRLSIESFLPLIPMTIPQSSFHHWFPVGTTGAPSASGPTFSIEPLQGSQVNLLET